MIKETESKCKCISVFLYSPEKIQENIFRYLYSWIIGKRNSSSYTIKKITTW